jgi:hypothetical protein
MFLCLNAQVLGISCSNISYLKVFERKHIWEITSYFITPNTND